MKTNQAGIDLIKQWEGFRSEAYLCPAKVWTIGYGHTAAAGDPRPVQGMKISQKEGEAILRRDLRQYEDAVSKGLKRQASANEFAAMVSLCFNIGAGAFGKSTMLRRFNAGDVSGAAEALTWWNKANGKVLRGLVNRREAERALFLTGGDSSQEPELSPSATIEGGEGKPIIKSKTTWGTMIGVAATATLTAWKELQESGAADQIGDKAPWVIMAIFVYLLFNRYREHRAGEH